MLDLFSGLCGASKAMIENGWKVILVDKEYNGIDICSFSTNQEIDLIWASPPCEEFSKLSMPWYDHNTEPDMNLVYHTKRIIDECNPKYWVVENTRGSLKYFEPIFGKLTKRCGSRYLYGNFPLFDCEHTYGKWKLSPGKNRKALRSKIPYVISKNLCLAVEREL